MTTNTQNTLQAWADIVIERWEARIRRLGIEETSALLHSFQSQVAVDSRGNAEKIVFTYLYYGRFPDMGVGKGVTIDQVGKKGYRKAKPWMGKIFFSQIQRLGTIMAEKLGQQAVINIIESFESNP